MSEIDQVLVLEHCHCIHEMLKEVHFWLQREDQIKLGGSALRIPEELPKDIFELRGGSGSAQFEFSETEEEQIAVC